MDTLDGVVVVRGRNILEWNTEIGIYPIKTHVSEPSGG